MPRHVDTNSKAQWRAEGHSADRSTRKRPHRTLLAALLRDEAPEYRSAAHPALGDRQSRLNWTRVQSPQEGRGSSFADESEQETRAQKALPPEGQQQVRGQGGLPAALVRAGSGTHRQPRTHRQRGIVVLTELQLIPSHPGSVEQNRLDRNFIQNRVAGAARDRAIYRRKVGSKAPEACTGSCGKLIEGRTNQLIQLREKLDLQQVTGEAPLATAAQLQRIGSSCCPFLNF